MPGFCNRVLPVYGFPTGLFQSACALSRFRNPWRTGGLSYGYQNSSHWHESGRSTRERRIL